MTEDRRLALLRFAYSSRSLPVSASTLSLSLSPASSLAPPALSPLNFDLFHVISAYKLPASEAAPLWPQRGLSLIDHFD